MVDTLGVIASSANDKVATVIPEDEIDWTSGGIQLGTYWNKISIRRIDLGNRKAYNHP